MDGLAFGITQIVPGVSGGSIAIILGFYDALIDAVNNFTKDCRKHLRFLTPFMLGVIFGIIAFSSVINYLLTNYSLPVMFFFIGMIAGIIPVICKKLFAATDAQPSVPQKTVLIIIPAFLLIAVSHIRPAVTADPAAVISEAGTPFIIFIFFAGVLAAISLVTPGISGSFVLLLLGVYHVLTYSVSSIRHLLTDMTNAALWLDICKILAPFAIGVIIGGVSMAKLIEKLLRSYYATVYSIILGLLLGSVYALFNEPIVFQSGVSPAVIIIGVITFAAGFAASFLIGRKRF